MTAKAKVAPKTAKFIKILGHAHVANKGFFLYENKGKGFVALENGRKTLWSSEFGSVEEAQAWFDNFAVNCNEESEYHKFRTIAHMIDHVLS